MAGVIDGQSVSAGVTNPAFIIKNSDDTMPNKLAFTRALSGASIADIQAAVNKLYTASGASESTSGTDYNAPSGTITNGENYQTSLYRLAVKFSSTFASGGHTHTGVSGDAPPLDRTSIVYSSIPPKSILFTDASQFPFGAPTDISWDYSTRFMGVRISNPESVIHADGDLSLTASDLAVPSDEAALAIGSRTSHRLTGSGSIIRGIANGVNGKLLILFNDMSADLILTNEDAAASSDYRILTPTAGDMTVTPDQATLLQYQGAVSRWVVISGGGGGGAGAAQGPILNWIQGENSPVSFIDPTTNIQFFTFEDGLNQVLWGVMKVPSTYEAGSTLTFRSNFVTQQASGDVWFTIDVYLIRPGVDDYDSTANSNGNTGATTVSAGTVNKPLAFEIPLTDGSGQIGGISVSPGDILRIRFFRDSDGGTEDVQWMRDSTEIAP